MKDGLCTETKPRDTVCAEPFRSKKERDPHILGVMGRRKDDSQMAVRPRPWIGENLRRLRNERGITQRRLAEVSGVGRAVITRLEGGLQDDANLGTLEDLAVALGTSVDELIAPPEGESEAAEIRAVIDEFERQELGQDPDHPPAVYAQPDEIAWLRSLPLIMWRGAPPTVELLAGFVQGYRRRRQ